MANADILTAPMVIILLDLGVVHAGYTHPRYHPESAIQEGWDRADM